MDRFILRISKKLSINVKFNLFVVSGHDNGLVKLWDYKQKTLIHTFNLSEKDELRKEKMIVQKIIEKDLKVKKNKQFNKKSINNFFKKKKKRFQLVQQNQWKN